MSSSRRSRRPYTTLVTATRGGTRPRLSVAAGRGAAASFGLSVPAGKALRAVTDRVAVGGIAVPRFGRVTRRLPARTAFSGRPPCRRGSPRPKRLALAGRGNLHWRRDRTGVADVRLVAGSGG